MRLRRENGDFSIIVNSSNSYATTINKYLRAEDLVGQIVLVDDQYTLITGTSDSSDGESVSATVGANTYTYTVSTGAFAKN